MKLDWWSLGLQTINVLVLLWILQRFLFKPVLAMIAQRQQLAKQMTDTAVQAKFAADQERSKLQAERVALANQREQGQAELHAELQQAREVMLAKVAQEAQTRMSAASDALQREREDVQTALRAQAAQLASAIARRLLERLPSSNFQRYFITGALEQLQGLSLAQIQANGQTETATESQADSQAESQAKAQTAEASKNLAMLELFSADQLSAEDQTYVLTGLGKVTGEDWPIEKLRFVIKPELIAGVELRLQHTVIRNNWATDLEHMMEQMHNDEHTAQ